MKFHLPFQPDFVGFNEQSDFPVLSKMENSICDSFFLLTENNATFNEGSKVALDSKISMQSFRRRRLQQYLCQIKKLIKGKFLMDVDLKNTTDLNNLSTLDALEKVIELLQNKSSSFDDSNKKRRTCFSLDSNNLFDEATECVTVRRNGSSITSNTNSTSTEESFKLDKQNVSPENTYSISERTFELSSKDSLRLKNPTEVSLSSFDGAASTFTSNTVDRKLGSMMILLPEGTVIKSEDETNLQNGFEQPLSTIIRTGDSLLSLLHDRGAQTLLLNAFCGQKRRRMYARVKWGSSENVRACEFICEFNTDPKSPARRIANIQVFCVEGVLCPLLNGHSICKSTFIFTTRHNAAYSILYLDSASIPLLGHFPSEITGKSLFDLVHPNDADLVTHAHNTLYETGGTQIVNTKNMRLIGYSRQEVCVSSEWAAFVNPWTRMVEMVVGRHFFESSASDKVYESKAPTTNCDFKLKQKLDEHPQTMHSRSLSSKRIQTENAVIATNLPDVSSLPETNNFCRSEIILIEEETGSKAENFTPEHCHLLVPPVYSNIQSYQDNSTNPSIFLSYNQINCLENVHRLLKSQSKRVAKKQSKFSDSCQQVSKETSQSPSLTRELLQKHDQRWEIECKKNRINNLSSIVEMNGYNNNPRKLDDDLTSQQQKTCSDWINLQNFGVVTPSARFSFASLDGQKNELLNLINKLFTVKDQQNTIRDILLSSQNRLLEPSVQLQSQLFPAVANCVLPHLLNNMLSSSTN